MPATGGRAEYLQRQMEQGAWKPQTDFQRCLGVRHADREVTTEQDLAEWLDDTGAIADAEVFRFIDPDLTNEIIRDAAARIFLDIRPGSEFYMRDEAVQRYVLRQAGVDSYGVTVEADGTRTVHEHPTNETSADNRLTLVS